jgi:hypothetical protein
MATLYTQADSNIRKTWLYLTIFFVLIISLGWLFSYLYNSQAILIFAVFIASTNSDILLTYSLHSGSLMDENTSGTSTVCFTAIGSSPLSGA